MPPVTSSSKMNTRQLFDNKENIPPAGPKSFEAFSNVYNPQFGRPPCPLMNRSDEERQIILDQRQKKEAKYVVFGPFLEYMVPTRKAISMQWHSLKYEALTATERHYVDITAHCLWLKELAGRKLRCQKATTKWVEDQDIAYQSIISGTKALDSKRIEQPNMPHKTTPEYFKRKLDREIYDKKCFIESNQKKLETLQKVDARTLEKQAEDAEMAWKPHDPAQKNKKKPAAKKFGRKTRADRQRDQESPVSARNVATGTTEYGGGQSKPEPGQKANSRKSKNKPTLKEVEAQRAKSIEDQLKATSGDSEGHSDVDEAIRVTDQASGGMNPSKKRKTSPKSDDVPAEEGQVGVARHLNRSGRPLKKAAVKRNVSQQHGDKNSPVPTTSSDTSKSTSTDEKEQSSSPPTSHTSTSSKRKQPSSTNSEEPASKKQMLGHSGNGQRVVGSSHGSNNTEEEDSAYVSQSDTSRRSDRKIATPKSRKSMSPPAQQQPRSLSPKRKRVSGSAEEESASKKQALEVEGIQVSAPASNGLSLEDEEVELELKEMVDNVEAVEPGAKRKTAVPKSRKNSSATTPPSASTMSEQRQPSHSGQEQISHEEQALAFSIDKASVGSAEVRSINTGSNCNIAEEESNRAKKEDEQPEDANKGKEEEQAVKETKEAGENNDSSAQVAADTSELLSPAPIAAPVKPTKKISLADYIAARRGALEKRKAQVEDNGETDGRQSKGGATVGKFKPPF